MNSVSIMFILLVFLILLIVSIFSYYYYQNRKINNSYKNMLNTKSRVGNAKKLKKCPKGCIRGTCDYKYHCNNPFLEKSDCCAFDFECQYCKDITGEYYLKPGENPKLDFDLYNPDSIKTQKELNEVITKQNKYIMKLNKNIKRKNKYILRRKKNF